MNAEHPSVPDPAGTARQPRPSVPLDYGHQDGTGDFSRRVKSGTAERFDGFFQFIGMIVGMLAGTLGGFLQIVFAVGVAFFVGGIASMLDRNSSDTNAIMTLAVGCGLIALCLPLPKRS